MKKYQTYIIGGVAVIISLAGGYFWGRTSASSVRTGFAVAAGTNISSSSRARFGSGSGSTDGGFATGRVIVIGSSSFTLQLANGNSEVVFYSSSTEVTKPTIIPIGELANGSNVMIGGTTNSDGSFTAQSIQVRPSIAGQSPMAQ